MCRCRWWRSRLVAHDDVPAVDDVGDVDGHGGVGPDPVGLHESEELRLGDRLLGTGGCLQSGLGLGLGLGLG